jgi:hypothetical protein
MLIATNIENYGLYVVLKIKSNLRVQLIELETNIVYGHDLNEASLNVFFSS